MLPVDELELLGEHVDVANVDDDDELGLVEMELDGLPVPYLIDVVLEEYVICDGKYIDVDPLVAVILGLIVTGLELVLREIVPELDVESVPLKVRCGIVDDRYDELPPSPVSALVGAVLIRVDEPRFVAVALLGVDEEPLKTGGCGQ
jgi:hypothetical protein